ncbi:RNA methyltransferase [Marinigracilibium pacificum]|uniref:RNA methyltransferase n=1 Tax=Marinigracilibium pacificum TaxID=2729599 RepID=A0A848J1G1_9BACT|nr:RNA methyltransferase [Marinigracilibium pacificum]NMM47062.1 RNA methyltransferase [Marinigracilibium pacificum]
MRKLKTQELNRLSPEEFEKAKKIPLVLVLDNIRSMNNVGSCFRTADAFRLEKIYLCGITAQPPHREIHKTALGATETVEWEYNENVVDCLNNLKDNGYKIYSLEQADKSILLDKLPIEENSKIALVLGNEVSGVSDQAIKLSDLVLEIPQYGSKHSFNVSVATGIATWEIIRKNSWLQ